MNFLGDVFDFLTSSDQWHGDESIPRLLGQHVQLTVVSVLVAAIVALPIGILLGHVRTGGALAVNIANIGRALPAFALLILSVQWVGIGDPTGILTPVQSVPAFIAMFALAVPPMLANAYVGMANVDDEIRESARGMGMNARQMIWRVELPNAMPLVMAGVRTATVGVVATATLAALVDSGGFGRYIIDGIAVRDNAKVFAGGLLVALLAIALELVLALVQRWVTSPGLRRERRATMADAIMERIPGIDQPAL
jgi:osmoprotectant transport system permease protein